MPAKTRTRAKEGNDPTNDDFYQRLRERIDRWAVRNEIKPAYRKYMLALPDMFHLMTRLMLDGRVDAMSKTVLGVAVAYTLSPIDLIPEIGLGPLGFVDDLLVVVLALDTVLKRTPRKVVQDHWAGDGDVIELISSALGVADSWVGKGMYRRIRDFLAERGIGKASEPAPSTSRSAVAARTRAASTARKPVATRAPASARPASAPPTPATRRVAAAHAAQDAARRKKTAKRPAKGAAKVSAGAVKRAPKSTRSGKQSPPAR